MENNHSYHQLTNVNPNRQFGSANSPNMHMETSPLYQHPNGQSNAHPTYIGNGTHRQMQQRPTPSHQNASLGCWQNNSLLPQGIQQQYGQMMPFSGCHSGNCNVVPLVHSASAPMPKPGRGRPRKTKNVNIEPKQVKRNGTGKKKQKGGKKAKNGNESTDDEKRNGLGENEWMEPQQQGQNGNGPQQQANEEDENILTPSQKKEKTMEKKRIRAKFLGPFVVNSCTGLNLVEADNLFSACCFLAGKYIPTPKTENQKCANMKKRVLELFHSLVEVEGEGHVVNATKMFADKDGYGFDRNDMNLHIYVGPKTIDEPAQDRNEENVKMMRVYGVEYKFIEFTFALKMLIPMGKGDWNCLFSIANCKQHAPFHKAICINPYHYFFRPMSFLQAWMSNEFDLVKKMLENGEEDREKQNNPLYAHLHESMKRVILLSRGENGGTFPNSIIVSPQQQYLNANSLAFMPSDSNATFVVGGESTSSEYSSGNSSSSSCSPSSSGGIQFPDQNSPFYGADEEYISAYLGNLY